MQTKMAKKKAVKDPGMDVTQHELVPTHEKLSDKEKAALLERYHATLRELPKISVHDPGLHGTGVKPGDVIRIKRPSPTAGSTVFYRGVIDE